MQLCLLKKWFSWTCCEKVSITSEISQWFKNKETIFVIYWKNDRKTHCS